MPVLRHPSQTQMLQLPPREAQVAAETDVLVVGGGPAGMGAALGAAACGADVILVEKYGFLAAMPLLHCHASDVFLYIEDQDQKKKPIYLYYLQIKGREAASNCWGFKIISRAAHQSRRCYTAFIKNRLYRSFRS